MAKILVVEDQDFIRTNILELLATQGYAVIGAENGREGVDRAHEFLPDLILCDIIMPELDGYGVLQELRQSLVTATIPFIFLTARADKSALRQGMNLGADDYLTKPFAPAELLETVSTRLMKQAILAHKIQTRLDELRAHITLALPQELQLPLTGILGSSELLLEEAASLPRRDIQDLARNIQLAGKRLQDLLMHFLLYTDLALALRNPELAATVKDPGPCYVESVVTEIARDQARRAYRAADLQLDVEPATVWIGTVHLSRLIKEIVDNACKFSLPGRPVRVIGRPQDSRYHLAIEDLGRGMTPDEIADIGMYPKFERRLYEQAGQGLGLIIARGIAELHGGKLTIDSVYGEGSTVRLSLPLCVGEASGIGELTSKVWHDA